jgi:hypothetical protein
MERYPGRVPFSIGCLSRQPKERLCVEICYSRCNLSIQGLTRDKGSLLSSEIDRVSTLFTENVNSAWYSNIYADLKTVTNATNAIIITQTGKVDTIMKTETSGVIVAQLVECIVTHTNGLTRSPSPFVSEEEGEKRVSLDATVKMCIMYRGQKEGCNCND